MTTNNLAPIALTVEEAAELLRLSVRTVYELTHREDFPVLRIGKRTLIPYGLLRAWAESNATGGVADG